MARPDGPLIAWLGRDHESPEDVTAASDDTAVIGGKGASLQRLAQLGFRTPPGFCLTTAAFRLQVAGTSAAGASDMAALLERSALADPVARSLASATQRLEEMLAADGFAPRFAVRSSAVAEDGSAASYAGLHETELDVPPDGVAAAVRRCWASLWSPAAIAYRRRRELSAEDVAMAVVVQALVPADASAVVFTRHPVTGREDQIVLTSTRGLGDAMVSGTITPDTTVVDKATGDVLEFDAGDGSTTAAGPALAPAVLDELIALCVRVEARFGQAVDVEAAHAGGTWFLLQARPITTGASTDAPVAAA